MSSPTKVVIFGATGYVGGLTLTRLLNLPNLSISVLVRSAVKAQKLRALNLGINIVEGSPTTDAKIVENLLFDADLVVNAYDCDDVQGATNIIEGLKKSPKRARVLHVSGLAIIVDFAKGRSPQESNYKAYDDTDIEKIAALPETAPHHPVDLMFQKADEQGHIFSYLLFPGAVFGLPTGILSDAGIIAAQEFIINFTVQPIKTLGGKIALTVGDGLNEWPVVEAHECIDLFVLLIKKLLSPERESVAHGAEGYYFATNGTIQLKEMALAAARFLSGQENPEHRPYTQEEMDKVFPFALLPELIGSNAVATSTRSRSLGWKPVQGAEQLLKAAVRSLQEKN